MKKLILTTVILTSTLLTTGCTKEESSVVQPVATDIEALNTYMNDILTNTEAKTFFCISKFSLLSKAANNEGASQQILLDLSMFWGKLLTRAETRETELNINTSERFTHTRTLINNIDLYSNGPTDIDCITFAAL
jgi:hypothetical protein